MPFLLNCILKIYKLPDTITPVWTGSTDVNGRAIDINGLPPSLKYGNYRAITERCDYDNEIYDFAIPGTSVINMSIGCTSSITTHEATYDHSKLITGLTLPSGIGPLPYVGATPPPGWILCDGAAVSRITYARLFVVIGNAYGNGDGVTTFNVPNMRGRIPVGIGASGVTTLGSFGGEQNHILTIAELPSHTHTYHSGASGPTSNYAGSFGGSDPQTGATGGNGAHNNMQPYLGVNYIISI